LTPLTRRSPPVRRPAGLGGRRAAALAALALLLLGACLLSVCVGPTRVSPAATLRVLLEAVGLGGPQAPTAVQRSIILHVRLPRVAAALLVGAALAMGGTAMQGLFRNPMASPDVLGVSTGASLGAVLAIHTGLFALHVFFLPAAALAGALLAAALIYGVSSHRGRTSLLFVVLAGLAISALFGALVSATLLFSQQYEVSQFIFWTMGGLDGRTWRHVLLPLPLLLPGMVLLALYSRDLNLFALGEDHAQSLGLHVERTKRIVLALTAAVTGMAIAVSGPVGFVGLLTPHLLRLLVGPDHRVLLPAAAIGGALLLVVADLVGRVLVPPYEIRVGIVTAVLGSPYFLAVILRTQRRGFRGFS
jgi:iron complex transport system permease protein